MKFDEENFEKIYQFATFSEQQREADQAGGLARKHQPHEGVRRIARHQTIRLFQ